ncbi:MAG: SiaB family protein kinase [Defluviitaleaceae bacterium]|nr:SiaB family protein kinase [Defluviitaleaceae bacterium]
MLDMSEYTGVLEKLNIKVIYNGPMWDDGIKGLAEMVRTHLMHDQLSGNMSKAIFSVFVEQVTNILMYSAEKEKYTQPPENKVVDVSIGTVIMGNKTDKRDTFFVQTKNAVKNENVVFLSEKIDHLNTMDKSQLRQFYKEKMRCENDSPDSQGAGLGLIEIARRATAPISYSFEPISENLSSFTLYVEITQEGV